MKVWSCAGSTIIAPMKAANTMGGMKKKNLVRAAGARKFVKWFPAQKHPLKKNNEAYLLFKKALFKGFIFKKTFNPCFVIRLL